MLEVDSEKRLTSADVLEHPWVAVRHHKLMTWLIIRRHFSDVLTPRSVTGPSIVYATLMMIWIATRLTVKYILFQIC